MTNKVTIVGAGLAGSEAALQLAGRGVDVRLYECRPKQMPLAHHSKNFAELVCSNSFKGTEPGSATAALKFELAAMGSYLLSIAKANKVSAGAAFAVDRERFSAQVTQTIEAHPLIEVVREPFENLQDFAGSNEHLLIACGPLPTGKLAEDIKALLPKQFLSFFDAAAPILDADSLDMDVLIKQSRYNKGGADYLNSLLDKETYEHFVEQLINADLVVLKEFESKDLFQACQPVEQVAKTGINSLRFGALKPVGIVDPKTDKRPWACIQLRAENLRASAYNLVGFQTNLTFAEQKRVFRLIPGLENADFLRYGVMHRNTFIDSPHILDKTFALPKHPNIRFLGQITGTEGYLEAVASGLYAAINTYVELCKLPAFELPATTVTGSLFKYATSPETKNYQPMHVNFVIIDPLDPPIKSKKLRNLAYHDRSLAAINHLTNTRKDIF
jgi:methylenetetrahydrofolate--tRNA-(uracil-5-)-methyltransferase